MASAKTGMTCASWFPQPEVRNSCYTVCGRNSSGFKTFVSVNNHVGRCSGLIFSMLVPRASGPCSSPGGGHSVVFLGKARTCNYLSQCLSPPRCTNGY